MTGQKIIGVAVPSFSELMQRVRRKNSERFSESLAVLLIGVEVRSSLKNKFPRASPLRLCFPSARFFADSLLRFRKT